MRPTRSSSVSNASSGSIGDTASSLRGVRFRDQYGEGAADRRTLTCYRKKLMGDGLASQERVSIVRNRVGADSKGESWLSSKTHRSRAAGTGDAPWAARSDADGRPFDDTDRGRRANSSVAGLRNYRGVRLPSRLRRRFRPEFAPLAVPARPRAP